MKEHLNLENIGKRRESEQKISLEIPAVESLFDEKRATEFWPESLVENEAFLEQLKERKELNQNLDDVISRLPRPDISLRTAIEQGLINEEQTEKLYDSLSDTFTSDEGYQRLALYLPFEFLPDKEWQPTTEALRQAADRFKKTYIKTWNGLLSAHDVRANFLDGDVLEVQHRVHDLPEVVKAAHLIPKLVEKGLLETKDAIALMEDNNDEVLRNSIADALPVLADMGYIGEKEIKKMEGSKDRLINNMARIIASQTETEEKQTEPKTVTLSSIQEKLTREFSIIETRNYGNITEKRKAWLAQKKKQEAIEMSGEKISAAINKNELPHETTVDFLSSKANSASRQTLIEGIRMATETTNLANPEKAQILYAKYKEILLKLWDNSDTETKETLSKTFCRFRKLDIIDDKQLTALNIKIPKLAGPFSENLATMKEEINDIKNAVESAATNPKLSRLIYPAALTRGSRLKGYGQEQADIDIGVLVRPGISLNERGKLRTLLAQTFVHNKVQGPVMEFWLEEKGGKLYVRNFPEHDASLGASYLTSSLFDSVWIGDKKIMRELREKLLVPYMQETDKTIKDRNARSFYLEEMESDALQYRLMHKGYERYFPPYGGIKTPHADEIDGSSMFWDSGFRQLATKLFLSRVFLPKIPISKKQK